MPAGGKWRQGLFVVHSHGTGSQGPEASGQRVGQDWPQSPATVGMWYAVRAATHLGDCIYYGLGCSWEGPRAGCRNGGASIWAARLQGTATARHS